jgi:hypothetical protein
VRLWTSRPQPSRDCRAEGEDPAPDGLIRDRDPLLGREFLDISKAEREAQVHPHGTLDDVRWEAVARIRDWGHGDRLRRCAGHGKTAQRANPGLDAALSQELLHIAVAQREPEVEPRCVPDDLGRKLVAGVGDGPHGSALPTPSHPVHLRVTVPNYQALIRAGKPPKQPKLAITAVMRKLLCSLTPPARPPNLDAKTRLITTDTLA